MQKTFTYVYGASGTGKTLYVKHMARQRINNGGRVLVVDPNAVFDGYGDAVDVAGALRRLRQAAEAAARGEFPAFALTVRPTWGESVRQVWPAAFGAGRLLVVVDEARRYASAAKPDPEFLELNEKGRNRYVDLATTSQQPKSLAPLVRGNYDVVVTFRQTQQDHADYIATEYFNRPELAEAIRRLPDRHYIRGTVGGQVAKGGPVGLI